MLENYLGVSDASFQKQTFLSYISNSELFLLHLDYNCQLYTRHYPEVWATMNECFS